ncbi:MULTISPECIES: beta-N-acetylhexosaminidase [Candidatus Ichthyocystis]|uniref:beta-N-acetylhexosaminidase n=1 Tax=Candidatus Ichthyocystis hellenicum TaxID=1561003 RepID=A0A0S4M5S5_9BURK|nr:MULTISPECIES: beta-N-acetylhexosaminidase [Ichthyocystis]CUT17606.1 Beta-hexosaminidase [Candidatus Ichthyocystis hellenicum]
MQLVLGPVIVSFHGTELNEESRKRLSHPAVGGVILFSRNFEDMGKLLLLIKDIKSIKSPRLLVSVDHEGGRVQRFRNGWTLVPSARDIGDLYNANPEEALLLATDIGVIVGYELAMVGIDLTYAPVLDIDYHANDVIGDRAFHRDPAVVSFLAECFIEGVSASGVRCVGKHYPAHGYVQGDSHFMQLADHRVLEMLKDDLRPYYDLRYKLSGIMACWVSFSKVDHWPACLSSFWINYLRQDIGFRQCVISDDLSMQGASVIPDLHERLYRALDAGCDMVCLCDVLDSTVNIDDLLDSLDVFRLHDCQKHVDDLRASDVNLANVEPRYRAAKFHLSEFVGARLLPSLL